jgi:hypothetical protein
VVQTSETNLISSLQEREIAVLGRISCQSVCYDISVQLPAEPKLCHLDDHDVRNISNRLRRVATSPSRAPMAAPGYVSYRLFATIEGEEWPDVNQAQPLAFYRPTSSTPSEKGLPDYFIACTENTRCFECPGLERPIFDDGWTSESTSDEENTESGSDDE